MPCGAGSKAVIGEHLDPGRVRQANRQRSDHVAEFVLHDVLHEGLETFEGRFNRAHHDAVTVKLGGQQ